MALSNWDVLAVRFASIERRLADDDSDLPGDAHAAQAELDAFIRAFAAEHGDAVHELVDDVTYRALADRLRAARTLRQLTIEQSDGVFRHEPSDWTVRIYKNWLYAGSARRHTGPDSGIEGYTADTLMEIRAGELMFGFGRPSVTAWRGPQDGVFCVVACSRRENDTRIVEGMIGCGVYAYDDNDGAVGVTRSTIDWFAEQLQRRFAGEAPAAVDLNEALRFNQGDRFFASEFGIETPTSAPGAADEPFLHDVIRGLTAGDRALRSDEHEDHA